MIELESKETITVAINGISRGVEISVNRTLLDVLRDEFGLTGAKRSCDVQVCGACAVLVDGLPVSSCCMLAADVDGCSVVTVEGLCTPGGLTPVQWEFASRGALQCGFCTPGMVIMASYLKSALPGTATRQEVCEQLEGNLCRCTGYDAIVDAILGCLALQGLDTD